MPADPVGTVDTVAITNRSSIRIYDKLTNKIISARRVCTVGIIYAIKITIIKRDFSRRSYMPSIVRIIRARRDIKLSIGIVINKIICICIKTSIAPYIICAIKTTRLRRAIYTVGTITNIVMVDIYSTRMVDRPSIECSIRARRLYAPVGIVDISDVETTRQIGIKRNVGVNRARRS